MILSSTLLPQRRKPLTGADLFAVVILIHADCWLLVFISAIIRYIINYNENSLGCGAAMHMCAFFYISNKVGGLDPSSTSAFAIYGQALIYTAHRWLAVFESTHGPGPPADILSWSRFFSWNEQFVEPPGTIYGRIR